MADYQGQKITRENLAEFRKWLGEREGGKVSPGIRISADLPYSEFLAGDLTPEQIRVCYAVIVADIIAKVNESHEEGSRLYGEFERAKDSKTKEAKIRELGKLIRLDEFMDLDMVPKVSSEAIEALSYRGLMKVCTAFVANRPLNENLKVLQYWYVASDLKEMKSARLTKEEQADLNKLFEIYKANVGKSGGRSAEVCNLVNNMDRILSTGAFLKCKSLSEEQRRLAVGHCQEKYWLKYFQEKDFDKDRINKMLLHPTAFLSKEIFEDLSNVINYGKNKVVNPYPEEYEKFRRIVLSTVEGPAYDAKGYGRRKWHNEQFIEKMKEARTTISGSYSISGSIDFRNSSMEDMNCWRDLYKKTAEMDIMEGHVRELSPLALGYVLSHDKENYFARMITPEDLEVIMKKEPSNEEMNLVDNERYNIRRNKDGFARKIFVINRNVPRKPEELLEAFRGDLFKVLTPEEREHLIALSEFASKLDVLGYPGEERRKALEDFDVSFYRKADKKEVDSAIEKVVAIESKYEEYYHNLKREIDNEETISAVGRACVYDFQIKNRAKNTITNLQELYGKIAAKVAEGHSKTERELLNKEALEKVAKAVLSGENVEIKLNHGKLPLFGKSKEGIRRDELDKAIYDFFHHLKRDKEVNEELLKYDRLLDPSTGTEVSEKRKHAEKAVAEVRENIKKYHEALKIGDSKNLSIENILQYKPRERIIKKLPLEGLRYKYDIVRNIEENDKQFNEVNKTYNGYKKALKEIAKKRLGRTKQQVEIPDVVKGQGKTTHDQRERRKEVNASLVDPLAEKPSNTMINPETKKQIKKAICEAKEY